MEAEIGFLTLLTCKYLENDSRNLELLLIISAIKEKARKRVYKNKNEISRKAQISFPTYKIPPKKLIVES